MEGNDLMVSPLEAEQKPERTVELERLIDERLPFVELSELLIEVDGWTHFSDGGKSRGNPVSGKSSVSSSFLPEKVN